MTVLPRCWQLLNWARLSGKRQPHADSTPVFAPSPPSPPPLRLPQNWINLSVTGLSCRGQNLWYFRPGDNWVIIWKCRSGSNMEEKIESGSYYALRVKNYSAWFIFVIAFTWNRGGLCFRVCEDFVEISGSFSCHCRSHPPMVNWIVNN